MIKKRQYVFVIRSIHLSNQDCHIIIESIFFCFALVSYEKQEQNKQTNNDADGGGGGNSLFACLIEICLSKTKQKKRKAKWMLHVMLFFIFISFVPIDGPKTQTNN